MVNIAMQQLNNNALRFTQVRFTQVNALSNSGYCWEVKNYSGMKYLKGTNQVFFLLTTDEVSETFCTLRDTQAN